MQGEHSYTPVLVPRPLLVFMFLAALLMAAASGATGQSQGGLDVIEISGPLDDLAVRYLIEEIEASEERGAQGAIVQLDSPGSFSAELPDLVNRISSGFTVVVWVGEAPAVAFGGAAELLMASPYPTAAPGVEVGFDADTPDRVIVIDETSTRVDEVQAAIGQIVVWLEGKERISPDGTVGVFETAEAVTENGETRLRPTVEVRFQEQSVLERIVRSALRPEAALFYLLAGLTLVAFEFYALGPGIAAATASLPLFLAGYGLVALPFRWWALVLVLAAWWGLTVDFQWGSFGRLSLLSLAGLTVGGLMLFATGPGFPATWWGVLIVVAVVAAFYFSAMPTVARSRFSTATIGRDHLIGREAVAVTGFDPDGVIEVDGARWRATAHREAGIDAGAAVIISGLDGAYLEVEPQNR